MEPVPSDPEVLPPFERDRIRRRGGRKRRVKSGVEARHGGDAGEDLADRVERGERLRLVQRGQIRQRTQAALHLDVDPNRSRELGTPVDDPVAHRVHSAEAADRLCHLGLHGPLGWRRKIG